MLPEEYNPFIIEPFMSDFEIEPTTENVSYVAVPFTSVPNYKVNFQSPSVTLNDSSVAFELPAVSLETENVKFNIQEQSLETPDLNFVDHSSFSKETKRFDTFEPAINEENESTSTYTYNNSTEGLGIQSVTYSPSSPSTSSYEFDLPSYLKPVDTSEIEDLDLYYESLKANDLGYEGSVKYSGGSLAGTAVGLAADGLLTGGVGAVAGLGVGLFTEGNWWNNEVRDAGYTVSQKVDEFTQYLKKSKALNNWVVNNIRSGKVEENIDKFFGTEGTIASQMVGLQRNFLAKANSLMDEMSSFAKLSTQEMMHEFLDGVKEEYTQSWALRMSGLRKEYGTKSTVATLWAHKSNKNKNSKSTTNTTAKEEAVSLISLTTPTGTYDDETGKKIDEVYYLAGLPVQISSTFVITDPEIPNWFEKEKNKKLQEKDSQISKLMDGTDREALLHNYVAWFEEVDANGKVSHLSIPSTYNKGTGKHHYYFYMDGIKFSGGTSKTLKLKYGNITIETRSGGINGKNEFSFSVASTLGLEFYRYALNNHLNVNENGVYSSQSNKSLNLHVLMPAGAKEEAVEEGTEGNSTKKVLLLCNHFILENIKLKKTNSVKWDHAGDQVKQSIEGLYTRALWGYKYPIELKSN